MRIIKYSLIVILTAVSIISCRKIEVLPAEPYIEFTSFAVFDTTDILGNMCKGGRLKFYFEDGDGDLGLEPAETGETDTTNMFLNLYRKTNGIFTEVPDNDLMKPSAYRIPYLEKTGQNKILKGTISVTFLYLFYMPEDNDTVKYEFYIKDRKEHYSDTVSTCEIPLSFNDLYQK
jgi:hypothetical protein